MAVAKLYIDLGALTDNWRKLANMASESVQTAAVVKADAYGLGLKQVAQSLAHSGTRHFFVAFAEEGVELRSILGPGPDIYILSGHMTGDTDMIGQAALWPLLSSPEQITRHFALLPNHPFGIQLDTGMNRLGLEADQWQALASDIVERKPKLIMSHLACADEPDHAMNAMQLKNFIDMTEGMNTLRSLAATGGVLLGKKYHFDMMRPGIGIYGGLPFAGACAVVRLELPVIQTRKVFCGESVGYSATWKAQKTAHIATLAAGYADGLLRKISNNAMLWHNDIACPLVGRVSMDAVTVDISHLDETPQTLDILNAHQSIDDLAQRADTIGYEILTSLQKRYQRHYTKATSNH